MPWDDTYTQEDEPMKPVTVGQIRHATALAESGHEPLIYDEHGNRLVAEKVVVREVGGQRRLEMQVRLEQPSLIKEKN